MKCFYHSADTDGHCSGALVKLAYPDCGLIPINYGDEYDFMGIPEDEEVWMVDFCIQPYELMREFVRDHNVKWVDHHKTAIEAMEGARCSGYREIGIGACQLVWECLHGSNAPYFVRLLAEYDVWDHSNPDTLPFQYGIRMYETDPIKNPRLWINLMELNHFVSQIISDGKLLLQYETEQNRKYSESCYFETEIDGIPAVAINKLMSNSKLFDSILMKPGQIMLTFGWRKGKWTVSLYGTDVDVSTIAKAHGGGGHAGAAGFQCEVLPFELK